jgi:two-component system sensor histidine kinase/response regulator
MSKKELDPIFEHPHVMEKMRRIQVMMERTEKIAQTGSWEWDADTDTVTWSRETYRFFGRDPAVGIPNLEGQKELYTPEDTRRLHATVAKAMVDGLPYDIELCGVRPSGEKRYGHILGFPERDASGKIVRLAGSLQDITDRKKAEEDLRHSQAQYRLLIDSLPGAAVLLFDRDFRFQIAGGEEIANNGFDKTKLEGRTLAEAFPPDVVSVFAPLYAKALAGEKSVFEQKYKDFYYQQQVVPVRDDQGRIIAGMVISHNITERKRAEEALSDANESLERRVAERTRELVEARNLAEAANIAKSAFLANMSHEIRTPLNAINGMCFLVRRSGVTPQQDQYLDHVDTAGEHLLKIISDILDISRIEAGKLVFEESEVDIIQIAGNVMSMLSGSAQAKDLNIVCDIQFIPHVLLGDVTRIKQALLNYASNAIKFSENGSITLRARVEDECSDSVLVRFEVEDRGIGIPAEAIARLFTPFEQADNSMTRQYGGTGLGLAITQRLAQLMGGSAGVDSVLGQGSTFWFTAQLRKGQAAAPSGQPGVSGVRAEEVLPMSFKGRRILVVEDDPLNREVVRMSLEGLGLGYDLAENGDRAVAMAASQDYALILMDMQMPKMGGIEATRCIRASATGARVPIIAMTANAFSEDHASCIAAGMNDFIAKPFKLEKLFETMLKWLSLDRDKSRG